MRRLTSTGLLVNNGTKVPLLKQLPTTLGRRPTAFERRSTVLACFAAIAFLTACAGSPESELIVDTKGVDMTRYHQDLDECAAYAGEVKSGEKVARSTARGTIVGGAIGAVTGNHRSVQKAAGTGAILGAAKGVSLSEEEKRRVVSNCMRGRGYKVLN